VCIRGNNIGAGEQNRGTRTTVAVQATRPEPPTCTIAADDWQDRVQRKAATSGLYR
jgi:hypothetical protein